jgi:catechol 2,3-dioxygenase-like lactoylglutathione lyase family enzyme
MATIDKLSMMHMAVTDMEKAKEFYTDKLGFTTASDSKDFMPGSDRWISIVPLGGGTSFGFDDPDGNHWRVVESKY